MKTTRLREMVWGSAIAALSSVLFAGCGPQPQTATSPTSSVRELSPEQRAQERARVLEAIRPLTPEQRTAYFKAHPEDASALSH